MILILAEKPSAARNFATALGGMQGTFNGEQYKITSSAGHLYRYPEKVGDMCDESTKARYTSWNVAYLPWDYRDLNWKKVKDSGKSSVLKNIKLAASGCDEICIATDDDPTGEGELLAWEIIDGLKLKAPRYTRMYFEDETPSSVQKAFISRKYLGNKISCMYDDPDFKKADTRSKWDYLSMQWTRIAKQAGDGHAVLRQGRLKSAMVYIVGEQLKLIDEYKEIPFFQNRFKDENGIVYTSAKEPKYSNEGDVPRRYTSSPVVKDSETMKYTAPPKLLDLATLSARLASSGLRAKEVTSIYQKMYEDHIVSYPRTEDKFVSPEQFNELLPLIDRIADLVGVDSSLLTHRIPRVTHVKSGGSHGANRPGTTVPSSLSELDLRYGRGASQIYKMLACNYLAMLAEDYAYKQQKGHVQKYPDFVGTANVPISAGWKAVFSDDATDDDESAKGLGTNADPFVYRGVNPKPTWPTMKWLMKQLEKEDVGTGATRTSIYAEVTNDDAQYPLLHDTKGKITMTQYGRMSYRLLPGTKIGDVKTTAALMQDMRNVGNGTMTQDQVLANVAVMVKEDMKIMIENGQTIESAASDSSEPKYQKKEKYIGTWKGDPVTFTRVWGGHRFTDEECTALCEGEDITFMMDSGYGERAVTGHLALLEYKGVNYVGFEKADNADPERYSGEWNGKHVSFKRMLWKDAYTFSDDECAALCRGETLTITVNGQYGARQMNAKLAELKTSDGHPYIGVSAEYPGQNSADYYRGTWNGRQVRFHKEWRGKVLTDKECEKLCAGKEVVVRGVKSKSGSEYSAIVKLAEKTSQSGHPYVAPDFVAFADKK